MIIMCETCGEEYDYEMFPVCPFCLTPYTNIVNQKTTKTESVIDVELENKNIIIHPLEIDNREESAISDCGDNNTIQEPLTEIQGEIKEVNTEYAAGIESDQKIKDGFNKYSRDRQLAEEDGLSARARNVLLRNGIFTISALLSFVGKNDLSVLRNVGAKTIAEINNFIKRYSLSGTDASFQNEVNGSSKISDVYCENKYKLFVGYCAKNGIETINDLSGFDFDLLRNVQGIGNSKITDIVSKYEETVPFSPEYNRTSTASNNDLPKVECLFNNINEQLHNIDIHFLSGFGVRCRQYEKLKEAGYATLGDLKGISVNRLSSLVGKHSIELYRNISQMLQNSLIEIFGEVLASSSDDNKYVITLLRAEGYTLQDIGELVNLTRERIRQIVEKYLKSLNPFMKLIVDSFMQPKGFVTVQEMLEIYDNDDFDKILIYWCKNSGYVHYLNFADVFIPAEINLKAVYTDLSLLADDFVGEGVKLSEHIDDLAGLLQEKNYYYLDIDAFLNFMQYHGFVLYGDYVVKGHQSYGALCARIVAKKFPKGIKINDSHELSLLRRYAREEYGGIELTPDDRAFSVRVSEYLILRGRGVYTAEENIFVEPQLLDELKSYIDDRPEAEIYYSDLYARFEGMISMMSDIDNYNYLHGVLKLYYSQEYDFSMKDYLTKRGDGLVSGRLCDRLKKYILKIGKPIHKNDIKKEFPGASDIVLFNAIASDDSLFQWDYNMYSSLDIIKLTDEERYYLRDSIIRIMTETNGYCSSNMLFNEINHNRPEIINNNHMSTPNNLFYLSAGLFSEQFEFKNPHIVQSGLLEEITVKNVALQLLNYPSRLLFSDYQRIASELQWAHVTAGIVFAEIEKDYFRIDSDLYIKMDQIHFDRTTLLAISENIKERMKNGFVSLITIDFDGLPELEYEWNSYLLRSIIDHYCPFFKIVETRSKDRRYERGIIIEESSTIKDYIDLIIYLMKANNLSEIPENKMLSLLVINGLTYKMIPKELYVSNKLQYKNEMFSIES